MKRHLENGTKQPASAGAAKKCVFRLEAKDGKIIFRVSGGGTGRRR